jgi:hypothetical protein
MAFAAAYARVRGRLGAEPTSLIPAYLYESRRTAAFDGTAEAMAYRSMRMPLQEVAARGDGDDDAGPRVRAELPPHVLGEGLGAALREVEEQLAPLSEHPPQQARHGQDDMAMGHRRQHLLPQPLGPQDLLLLLAGGAEAAAAAGERAEHARAAGRAPEPGEAVLDEAALEEPSQHALDDPTQQAVGLGEALRIDAQEVFQVLLDKPEERGLPRSPRPVDPRADLHATPSSGGRDRRESRTTPRRAAGRAVCDRLAPRQVRITGKPRSSD